MLDQPVRSQELPTAFSKKNNSQETIQHIKFAKSWLIFAMHNSVIMHFWRLFQKNFPIKCWLQSLPGRMISWLFVSIMRAFALQTLPSHVHCRTTLHSTETPLAKHLNNWIKEQLHHPKTYFYRFFPVLKNGLLMYSSLGFVVDSHVCIVSINKCDFES